MFYRLKVPRFFMLLCQLVLLLSPPFSGFLFLILVSHLSSVVVYMRVVWFASAGHFRLNDKIVLLTFEGVKTLQRRLKTRSRCSTISARSSEITAAGSSQRSRGCCGSLLAGRVGNAALSRASPSRRSCWLTQMPLVAARRTRR